MLNPQWKPVRHGSFGWYVDETRLLVAALWLRDASFADASAKFSGTISHETAQELRAHCAKHATSFAPAPDLMSALESASLMAFRLAEDLGGGNLVVLPGGLMSTVPLGRLTQPTDEPAAANTPAIHQLFEATRAHALNEFASSRGADSPMTKELAQILRLASESWELILIPVSRQTLDCFATGASKLKTFLVSSKRIFFAVTTLPCAREDAPECLRQNRPASKYPYASLVQDLASQCDSAEYEFLIHSVITCNPSTNRMSLQLGVFPNATNMGSRAAIKLFPVEVITSDERVLIGL